jgi:hypothetical protein
MHDCIRSLVFCRFAWFLIIAFSFFSTPHVELIFPSISNLFVSDAHADTANTPILGRIVTDRIITDIAQAPNTDVPYGINSVTKDVYIFDLVNYKIKNKINLANTPVSLTVHRASNSAYVIQLGGLLSLSGFLWVVDPSGDAVSSVHLPSAPKGISINAAKKDD